MSSQVVFCRRRRRELQGCLDSMASEQPTSVAEVEALQLLPAVANLPHALRYCQEWRLRLEEAANAERKQDCAPGVAWVEGEPLQKELSQLLTQTFEVAREALEDVVDVISMAHVHDLEALCEQLERERAECARSAEEMERARHEYEDWQRRHAPDPRTDPGHNDEARDAAIDALFVMARDRVVPPTVVARLATSLEIIGKMPFEAEAAQSLVRLRSCWFLSRRTISAAVGERLSSARDATLSFFLHYSSQSAYITAVKAGTVAYAHVVVVVGQCHALGSFRNG